ncbi:MAG: BatA domain-containing protein [Planctomycetota bacterium]
MPTFLNGGVLGALALVGLPIAIHLLNRRRFKVVRWGAMEFLLAANKKNRKRVRLEHFLVLLLRCLAMALIVFLVARPVATSGALNYLPGARESVERVILLDDSGSMGYAAARSTAFARAKGLIRRIAQDMRSARSSDLLSVYRGSKEQADLPPSPPNERMGEFLTQLEDWAPSEASFDAVGALKRVLGRVLAGEDAPQRKVIYLLTDLRQRDWIGDQGLLPKALAQVMRAAPKDDVAFLIVDVGSSERRNLGITQFAPGEKLAMEGVPLQLVAKVKNHGTQTAVDVQLVLETGESRVPWPPIASIPPGEEVEVRHRYTFTSAGVRQLVLRLAEDPLALDDARALALDVRERLKVLLVDGDPRPGPLQAETAMLQLALAPADDSASGVEPDVVTPTELPGAELRSYQAVFLCNVEAVDASALRTYVERGGGLAVFLGDAVDLEAYRRDLYQGGQGSCPATWASASRTRASTTPRGSRSRPRPTPWRRPSAANTTRSCATCGARCA